MPVSFSIFFKPFGFYIGLKDYNDSADVCSLYDTTQIVKLYHRPSYKHAHVIYTPLHPTFI